MAQNQQVHMGQMTNGETHKEEFPALGGQGKDPNQSIKSATSPPANLINPSQASTSSQHFPNSDLSQPHPSLQLPPGMSHFAASHDPSIPLTKPSQQLVASPVDKWGLSALLRLIRTGGRDDQLTLSLGEDLANIGLDMNSAGPLYSTFIAPFAEPDALRGVYLEEEWRTPQCYNVNTPPASSKISMFSDETLFYAFYAFPRDLLQMEVSAELYARQWRYHKELSVWLTKDPGVEPIEKGPNYERGTYIIFDPAVFSRVETPKDFTLQYDLLEDRPVIVPPPALLQQVQQGQNQPQGDRKSVV